MEDSGAARIGTETLQQIPNRYGKSPSTISRKKEKAKSAARSKTADCHGPRATAGTLAHMLKGGGIDARSSSDGYRAVLTLPGQAAALSLTRLFF